MFFGSYNHQLDDKGRLRLPAKFRNELGGSFMCLKGYNDTVMVCSHEKFEHICNEYMKTSASNIEAQEALVELTSTALDIVEDSQGRFVLPDYLKEYASIEKNVVIKGVIDRIEIWSEKAHLERTTDKSFNDIIKKLDIGTF
ncbi:MAG: hypothetical protein RR107_02185 [Clostridia bacterium]